ncbi:cytochrome P450 [Stachybotrys elegans]|uniref:Cytochrome P450 n=1 Tax=Stachybotrys elegans TaxID=80388 RepID=A0A8K0SUC9_9HYPO|nr:cytochrome P450 [Stachybotrys elegans]
MLGLTFARQSVLLGTGGLLFAYWFLRYTRRQSKGPLPPGPKGLPIVGNVFDMPPPGVPEWQHWQKHKELYGGISSVTVMGQTLILIHDREIAFELLGKQALKNSSRPHFSFASDLVGYSRLMIFQAYDLSLRQQRRMAATQVGNKAVIKFQPFQEAAARRLLQLIIENPTELKESLPNVTGSLMLEMLYGYRTGDKQTESLSALISQVAAEFSSATSPGRWLVDMIPALKHLPDWFPGTGFKATAKIWKSNLLQSIREPYEYVRQEMAEGADNTSYVSGLIKDINRAIDFEEAEQISCSAQGLFAGGTDTSSSTLHAFFLAMILYPEVQEKAQAEIDSVVGGERLPIFSDRLRLPYIEAIVQELLRWHSATPMGFPHMVSEDDRYHGYLIPKGALIMPSIAFMGRDPAVYHDPEAFKPERFTEPFNEPPTPSTAFGFGRRVCPGRWMVEQLLFIVTAQCLAVFNMNKAVDVNGVVMEPKYEQTAGTLSHLKPYPYHIAPRSEKHRQLVKCS